MNRDSEVVHELVSSKYKIAERNRMAKYKFLSNENVTNLPSKHRGSEPSLAQTEKADVKPVNLSIPGTPISSRYLESLGTFKRNNEEIDTDSEDENDDESKFKSLLQEGLKQFTSDMEKLKDENEKSHDKPDSKESPKVSNGTDQKKELPAISKVEKYFQESARRGSLSRGFQEVVQVFDPRITKDYGNTSKPGTPVSSKFIKAEKISSRKLQPFTDNMKKLEALTIKNVDSPPEKPKRVNPVPIKDVNPEVQVTPATPLDSKDFPSISSRSGKAEEKEVLIVIENKIAMEPVIPIPISAVPHQQTAKEVPEQEEKPQIPPSEVSESTSQNPIINRKLSIPGTPVDSRKLYTTISTDDKSDLGSDIEVIDSSEVRELANELVSEIENMVQKTIDESEGKEEEDSKLLIIHDNTCKVKNYFEQSEKESSYQRTFSAIEDFNEPGMDVKEKVEKYFKESEDKKSLTRGFSEAVNYIEPVNIEELFKPGTPISSKVVEQLNIADEIEESKDLDPVVLQGIEVFKKAHEALHKQPEFKVDQYFKESEERHTLKRDFSEVFGVIGEDPKPKPENPEIKKFFEQSEAKKTYHRQFSDAVQTLPPRIKDILPESIAPIKNIPSSRASIFSAPDTTEFDPNNPTIARKHGKKYGIDKYFAASLYRTAYHRSQNQRRGSEPDHRFAILEDEYVFGENDVLRSQVFQDDGETPIHPKQLAGTEDDFDQQNVHFWRGFLKPYNLNLPTDIVVRDELIDKYAKYTLE